MDQVKTDEEIERNKTKQSTYKNSKLFLIKILVITKIIRRILTIKVITITITTIITAIIKCRGRYKTPKTTYTELLVTLYNGRKPLTNMKKSSTSDAVRVLYTPLKRLIHHLT